MRSKLSDLKSLYTTLGGESTDVLSANSEIAVLNGILALGNVDSSKFIPDAIKAIADNFALIDPSPAATLIEKTVTANGTYNATSDSANGYSQVNVAVPSADLITKTYTVPIPNYTDTIAASDDNADGYSEVSIAGPSDLSTWLAVELNFDPFENTITIVSTSEQLTAAYQGGKTNLYLKISDVI